MTNGNMWLEHNDYSLSGVGGYIEINRFYNSTSRNIGLFGYGFSTKYDENIQIFDERMIRLNLADGRAVYFVRTAIGQPFKTDMPDFYGQVVQNPDNSFTLTYQDGRIHQFAPNGKLVFQKDRQGNQTNMIYNANGLAQVVDPFGRTLQFNVVNGLVTQISDSLGVVATYLYNADKHCKPLIIKTVQSINLIMPRLIIALIW